MYFAEALNSLKLSLRPPLFANICRAIHKQPLEEWIPQSQFLGIIGTGDGYGVASKGGMGIEGAYLWKLKDKIDRQWMKGYQEFPTMEEMLAKKKREKQAKVVALGAGAGAGAGDSKSTTTQDDVEVSGSRKSKINCFVCGELL